MPSENLLVQHHQQDTDYYCGAACAQMVLQTIGAGILDQDDLYADNHSHSTLDSTVNWYTAPDGLQWTLNDRRPPSFVNYFALFALNTEDQISRKICWTIHHYQVAPVALVYGWAHWLVVRGYTASAHPSSSADNSYAIDGFDLNNPWPYAPSFDTPASAPPPAHSVADGCGTGGDRGIANEHVTYTTWQSTYMTGVPGGYWNGKFVAVCDPEPPANRGGEQRPPRKRPGNGRILAPKRFAELAIEGLKEYGLVERKEWQSVLQNSKPSPGMVVERLDRPNNFYSLVPFMRGRRPVAYVSVDARFGHYLQSALLPRVNSLFISHEQAFKLVVNKRIELGDRRGRLYVREGAICMYPHLVWRPCKESLSPYFPFYMFTVGRFRLYVRVDGAIFASLTLDQQGI
jgi:hypothetical protein